MKLKTLQNTFRDFELKYQDQISHFVSYCLQIDDKYQIYAQSGTIMRKILCSVDIVAIEENQSQVDHIFKIVEGII